MIRHLLTVALSCSLVVCAGADPIADMAAFSSLKNVDLAKLAGGEIMTAHGPTMSFQRGLAVESCYVVKAPVPKVLELQRQWSPAKHPELKVYLHGDIATKPTAENFSRITSTPTNGAVKEFVAATEKLNPEKPDIYVSAAEAKQFTKVAGGGAGGLSGPVGTFWGGLLLARAQAFSNGGLGAQPAYFWKGESLAARDELGHLLKEVPKWSAQFSGITDAAQSGAGRVAHYWELFDVEGTAAFTLGATFEKASPASAQLADFQYYASGGYFVLLTLYEMWPVKLPSGDGTLVWRCDLISSPALGELRGMERMGSSAAMMKQIKQSTRAFLKETPQ